MSVVSPVDLSAVVTICAPGYVRGDLASYAGIHVRAFEENPDPMYVGSPLRVDQQFNSGDFATDLICALFATRQTFGTKNLIVERSIDEYIMDRASPAA